MFVVTYNITNMKINIKNRGISIGITIIIFLLLCVYFFNDSIILKETKLNLQIKDDFNPKDNIQNVVFGSIDDLIIENPVDTSKKGDYTVAYRYKDQIKKVLVNVDDTTRPKLEVRDLKLDMYSDITPDMFVISVQDNSQVSLSFENDPDRKQVGKQELVIIAQDAYDNKTRKKVILERIDDKTPPVFDDKNTMTILQGQSNGIEDKIKVKDDFDPSPKVQVDYDGIDICVAGKHKIKVSAIDRSNNTSSKTFTLNVKENPEFNEKVVYLTFDDGPSPNTEKVLKILKQNDIKATFFVTGNGQAYNDYIKQAFDEGHTIALHTYTHDYSCVYASVDAYFDDLQKVSDMVENITKNKPKFIRFPGGSSNTISAQYSQGIMSTLTKEVVEKGYQYFDWNVSSSDASGINVPVETIIQSSCVENVDQINLLFHDGPGKETTVEALPKIIEYYKERGYKFYPISKNSYVPHHGVNN